MPRLTESSVSSGATLALQNFDFPDWPARYLRIVGHGNSVNNFNSFTEVAVNRATPVDVDSDGLPDGWEMFYFTNLTQTVSGDPDGDSLFNGQEFLRGTDPTQPNSIVDSDNDGLPDSWELARFGSLNQTASGDPDRDLIDLRRHRGDARHRLAGLRRRPYGEYSRRRLLRGGP